MSHFVAQNWLLWLIILVVSLGVIVLTFLASGLSLFRGGRGGPGPFRTPKAAVVGALVGGGLLAAAIAISAS